MLTYHLKDAHADYRRLIPEVLDPLASAWPGALDEVTVYAGTAEDRSLGEVVGKTMKLNKYWMAQPVAVLQTAGAQGRKFQVPGAPRWHDGAEEPYHLLTHEFGHGVQALLGNVASYYARVGHAAALRAPDLAASGYSLVDPEEWFAETFAMMLVGDERAKANEQVQGMRRFLEW